MHWPLVDGCGQNCCYMISKYILHNKLMIKKIFPVRSKAEIYGTPNQ